MAQRPVIKAQARNEFGKGAARRLRRANLVPGVIYGSNTEPIHFAAPILELHTLIRYHGANAVLELEIDGEQHLTVVRNVRSGPPRASPSAFAVTRAPAAASETSRSTAIST